MTFTRFVAPGPSPGNAWATVCRDPAGITARLAPADDFHRKALHVRDSYRPLIRVTTVAGVLGRPG